jgi:hypothetical protein
MLPATCLPQANQDRQSGKIMGGGMGERFNPAVLKTVELERVPGVRIPLPPPFTINYFQELSPICKPKFDKPGDTYAPYRAPTLASSSSFLPSFFLRKIPANTRTVTVPYTVGLR